MFRFLTRRWRFALALVLAAVTLTIAGFWFQSWRAQRGFEKWARPLLTIEHRLTIWRLCGRQRCPIEDLV